MFEEQSDRPTFNFTKLMAISLGQLDSENQELIKAWFKRMNSFNLSWQHWKKAKSSATAVVPCLVVPKSILLKYQRCHEVGRLWASSSVRRSSSMHSHHHHHRWGRWPLLRKRFFAEVFCGMPICIRRQWWSNDFPILKRGKISFLFYVLHFEVSVKTRRRFTIFDKYFK